MAGGDGAPFGSEPRGRGSGFTRTGCIDLVLVGKLVVFLVSEKPLGEVSVWLSRM